MALTFVHDKIAHSMDALSFKSQSRKGFGSQDGIALCGILIRMSFSLVSFFCH